MFCKSYNDFFQTLANRTNQSIINVLMHGDRTVTQIIAATRLEQSQVSHALNRLSECKLVNSKQKGKNRIYSLNRKTITPILQIADKHARQMCPICLKVKQ